MSEPLKHQYIVLYSETPNGGCAACVPDLPGVAVMGDTREETREHIAKAIDRHIRGLVESGAHIQTPVLTYADLMEISIVRPEPCNDTPWLY